jgi:DNA-binding NarL/FixJ family response regulator
MFLAAMAQAQQATIRVLLADAHGATLAGLRMALTGVPFEVVAEAADAGSAVAAAERERPDICVLDADMPGGAVGATAEIMRLLPRTGVVVLASSRDDGAMLDAVRAGAIGYLLKNMDPDRLRHTLEGVMAGEAALPRALVTRLMFEFRVRERRGRLAMSIDTQAELTAREWDVLGLMADGGSTRAMAESLGIAEATVRRHVSGVVTKLGVSSRAAAVEALRAAEGR